MADRDVRLRVKYHADKLKLVKPCNGAMAAQFNRLHQVEDFSEFRKQLDEDIRRAVQEETRNIQGDYCEGNPRRDCQRPTARA